MCTRKGYAASVSRLMPARVDGKDPLTTEGDLIRVSFFTQQSMKAPSANEVFIDC